MHRSISVVFMLLVFSSVISLFGVVMFAWMCEDVETWWYNGGRTNTLTRLAYPVSVIERIQYECSRR